MRFLGKKNSFFPIFHENVANFTRFERGKKTHKFAFYTGVSCLEKYYNKKVYCITPVQGNFINKALNCKKEAKRNANLTLSKLAQENIAQLNKDFKNHLFKKKWFVYLSSLIKPILVDHDLKQSLFMFLCREKHLLNKLWLAQKGVYFECYIKM